MGECRRLELRRADVVSGESPWSDAGRGAGGGCRGTLTGQGATGDGGGAAQLRGAVTKVSNVASGSPPEAPTPSRWRWVCAGECRKGFDVHLGDAGGQ